MHSSRNLDSRRHCGAYCALVRQPAGLAVGFLSFLLFAGPRAVDLEKFWPKDGRSWLLSSSAQCRGRSSSRRAIRRIRRPRHRHFAGLMFLFCRTQSGRDCAGATAGRCRPILARLPSPYESLFNDRIGVVLLTLVLFPASEAVGCITAPWPSGAAVLSAVGGGASTSDRVMARF
jgi:hypothetical protein